MARDIQALVRSERFVEALYYGALQLATEPSPKLHLLMGIACCGAIKPIADVQRSLRGVPGASAGGGLAVARSTSMVYEGFEHLIEARSGDPSIALEPELVPVVSKVLDDLSSYLTQEFHGFRAATPMSLGDAGLAAVVLLVQIGAGAVELPALRTSGSRAIGERKIEERLAAGDSAAAFRELTKT